MKFRKSTECLTLPGRHDARTVTATSHLCIEVNFSINNGWNDSKF